MNNLQAGLQVNRINTLFISTRYTFKPTFKNFTGSFNICLKSLQDIHLFVASYRSVSPSVYVFHEDQYLVFGTCFFFFPSPVWQLFIGPLLCHFFVITVPQLLSIIFNKIKAFLYRTRGQGLNIFSFMLTKFNSVWLEN